ncbi:undecaprenyl-diphosphate phosphatase [Clostridium akagii]|uniref:undecaprenyl-diphosphate phosphatase n=1 Tax=Clostridium akagii TaxID=91623 RepID=UPI000479BC97|nr:undecaprenyl-diphosphate phosphatase [Clostridium akagii]
MTILQTVILAIVQGITELFPISSAGHSVLTPYVFRWNLNPVFLKEKFLPLVVMMHLGTSIALFIFFWKDWKGIIKSIFTSRDSKKLLFLIIVGTIPAAIIGFVFEAKFTVLFGSALVASIFLILNGVLLFVGESAASKGKKDIEDLSYRQATVIGLFQSLALIPGFSRSGASITAGFWMGLKHEESARFSMLLATPIIAGASILEIPKLFKPANRPLLQIGIIGGIAAGICALISVNILMRWFNKKEINAMRPFSYYCWIVGGLILISHFI